MYSMSMMSTMNHVIIKIIPVSCDKRKVIIRLRLASLVFVV